MTRPALALFAQLAAMGLLVGLVAPRRPEEDHGGRRTLTDAEPWMAESLPPLDTSRAQPRAAEALRVAYVAPPAGPDMSPAPWHKGRGKGTRAQRKAWRAGR